MRFIKSALTVVLFVYLPVTASYAGWLEKRHEIELRLGMWNQVTASRAEVSSTGVSTAVDGNGFLAGLAYSNWLSEATALNISLGIMTADVSTDSGILGVATETSTVTSILMGVKQYFPRSTFGNSTRPYARVSAGPFFGHQSNTSVGTTITVESRSQTAFGGHVGAGVDFVLGRHVATGLAIGYTFMSDFGEPIGGSVNYSGPEFSFGIGYLFGQGVD